MKKNKTIKLAIIMMLITASLFARDIRIEGTGNTREEAELNARNNLSSYLSLDISSTTVATTEDDGSSSSSTLHEQTTASSRMNLLGVQLSKAVQKKGVWHVDAFIAESAADLYIERVNSLIPILSNIDMTKTGSLEDRITYYLQAKQQYRDFDTYVMILRILTDGSYRAPNLQVTLADVDSRYNTLLNSMYSSIDQESYLLDEKAKRGELSKEDMERRAEIEDSKIDIQNRLDELYREQETRKKELEKAAGKDMRSYLDKLNTLDTTTVHQKVDVTDPVKFILGIEDYRNIYHAATSTLETELQTSFSDFEKKANKIVEDRLSADNMTNIALVDEYGTPTADYIIIQLQNDIEPKIKELYKAYYSNARKKYDATAMTLGSIRQEAEQNLEILNEASFTASRYRRELSSSLSYKGQEWKWMGNAYLDIAGQEIIVPFEIPFEAITGKEGDFSRWTELEPILNMYHAVLTKTDNAYDVIVDYHIEGTLESNVYRIHVDEIQVINPLAIEEDRILYDAMDVMDQEFNITSTDENMAIIDVESGFGITGMLPEYKPLGLIPEPDLTVPEIPELRKAVKHSKEELPDPPAIEVEKDRYRTGSSKSFALTFRGSSLYDITPARCADIYSLGFSWRMQNPLFSNAHLRLGLGADFQHLNLENLKAGVDTSIDFMHYINSYTFFTYGINADVDYDLEMSYGWHIQPSLTLGIGGEMESMTAEIQTFLGCTMHQKNWTPGFIYGATFKLGIYLF